MNIDPLKQGALTENSIGIGTVTRGMVRERAVELALINGHSSQDVSKDEWEQARRELTGEPDIDPKQALIESVPESERWNLAGGSNGLKTPETSNEDEDDEGRSDSARLVEEGVAEAEHDQMLQAARSERQANEG